MTRMWMVNPKHMCRNHLLGEHKEIHQLVGSITKNKSIKGFIENGLVEVHNAKERHDELVIEMLNRGYKHLSPLVFDVNIPQGSINRAKNIEELSKRCKECNRLLAVKS